MAAAAAPQQWVAPTGPTAYPKIGVILGCTPDDGDVDLAYKILGLHSRDDAIPAVRPPAHEFVHWCNRLIAKIYEEGLEFQPGSVGHRRFLEASRRVRSAMHTISGIRRPGHEDWQILENTWISHWKPNGTCDDAPVDLTIANWDQNVPTPATKTIFDATYGPDRQKERDDRARDHRKMGKTWMATKKMVRDAREKEAEEWQDLVACYGFQARTNFRFRGNDPEFDEVETEDENDEGESDEEEEEEESGEQEEDAEMRDKNDEEQGEDDAEQEENNNTQGKARSPKGKGKDPMLYGVTPQEEGDSEEEILPYTFFASPVPKGEDSLWYSLSVLVHNRCDLAKTIKGRLANWFHSQLSDPASLRFRMYCQLLVDSATNASEDEIKEWGPLDLIRCLNRNERDAGLPKEAAYHEILYLIADYFGTEVITFTRPDKPRKPSDPVTTFAPSREASSERNGQPGPSGTQSNNEAIARERTPSENSPPPEEPYANLWLQEGRQVFKMRVYGSIPREGYILDPNNQKREQILLVTDSKLRYFQPVTRGSPELPSAVRGGHYIGTRPYKMWERWPPMPWWPGAKYHEGSKKWVGAWSTIDGRASITDNQQLEMKPISICRNILDPVTGEQIRGRYFEAQPPRTLQNRSYHDMLLTYEADTDTDRYGMICPTINVIKTWRTENPPAGQADPPLLRTQWRARTGGADGVKYRSKGHLESRKRTREEYAANEGLGFDDDYGWLRIEATEKESKVRAWHDKAKRRKLGW
ncbi:hypothetical protein CSIM01_13043 [Colletotrichum simmondsii]|uniref:Uncharacterized protein n=1 Tax=Colletotrichum simmondsii TaxID=703756 RepID=A0A135TKI9_9PEZI|nr:hypothetical protein CSIM01_13043 [Colletotrichum simmondsii]